MFQLTGERSGDGDLCLLYKGEIMPRKTCCGNTCARGILCSGNNTKNNSIRMPRYWGVDVN